ncbi:hypothetical protein RCH23_001592 [Cryobacterium sp. CAN_C3]|nr:hypothetical protein [Cryobacterium sp. CAN_C3]
MPGKTTHSPCGPFANTSPEPPGERVLASADAPTQDYAELLQRREDADSTLELKAAGLFSSLARNDPLADGNKRVSWILTVASFQQWTDRAVRHSWW